MEKVYDFLTDNEYLDYIIFELEKITQPKYLDSAKSILCDIPKEYHKEFVNMLITGLFLPEEVFNLLKETYQF